MFLVSPYSHFPGTMLSAIQRAGLTTSLELCLDASDIDSYDGTSQTWADVSGNGNNFYRGTTSSSQATDPTFNGVAGRQSSADYFSHDGGDWFTLAAGSPPSWQSTLHKSAGVFTILQWAYVGNLTALAPGQAGLGCGDSLSAADGSNAIAFTNSASTQNALSLGINNATTLIWGAKSTILVTNNAWQMLATSVDVASDPIRFAINGTTEDVNSAASGTPSTSASPVPLVIGAVAADGNSKVINGCRLAAHCLWTRALSAAELVSIFNLTRSKFGV